MAGEDLCGQSCTQTLRRHSWTLSAAAELWQKVLGAGSPHVAGAGAADTVLNAPTFCSRGKRPCEAAHEVEEKQAKITVVVTWNQTPSPRGRARSLMFAKGHSPPGRALLQKWHGQGCQPATRGSPRR